MGDRINMKKIVVLLVLISLVSLNVTVFANDEDPRPRNIVVYEDITNEENINTSN